MKRILGFIDGLTFGECGILAAAISIVICGLAQLVQSVFWGKQ